MDNLFAGIRRRTGGVRWRALPGRARPVLQNYLFLTVGSLVLSLNYLLFLAPQEIAPGGLAGLALITARFLPLSDGLILLGWQVVMMAIGWWLGGGLRFVGRLVYSSLLYSLGVEFLAPFVAADGLTADFLLNTVYGAVVGGIGLGFIYRGYGGIAGTSVISRILQRRTGVPTAQAYLMVDGGIIIGQGLILGWERALYGMMMLFLWGLATDYVQEGPSVVRVVFIVTDRPEAVAQALLQQLGVGVTGWAATGMYTHRRSTTLFCTVNRVDVELAKNVIMKADPEAYWVVGQGHRARRAV